MILTKEQRLSRKGDPKTWPGGQVPFVITSTSSRDRAVILSAIEHWKSAACVSFVEKSKSYNSGPHVRFIKGSGCSSHVGLVNKNSGQNISVGINCATLGHVAHEIGHALGFWHEQSRHDRDSYVRVLTENIQSLLESNFQIQELERARGVPYDLSSLMHYDGFRFSKNGLPTIVTNDIKLAGVIGQRDGLSHRDKQLANLMYNCDASCTCPPVCHNGGYLSASCQCVCPPGTSGTTCDTINGTYYGTPCGNQAIFVAGTITSPGYPTTYPNGKHCIWIVTAPKGKKVRIHFRDFKIFFRYQDICHWDYMTLHLDSDSIPELIKCGDELKDQTFTSEGKRLMLELHAIKRNYPFFQKGFNAYIGFV